METAATVETEGEESADRGVWLVGRPAGSFYPALRQPPNPEDEARRRMAK